LWIFDIAEDLAEEDGGSKGEEGVGHGPETLRYE
jgi:hypothetical protein